MECGSSPLYSTTERLRAAELEARLQDAARAGQSVQQKHRHAVTMLEQRHQHAVEGLERRIRKLELELEHEQLSKGLVTASLCYTLSKSAISYT